MSPDSQLFIVPALSGLGFLLSLWSTPRVHDVSALGFIWVPWLTVTSWAMLYNGRASPLIVLLCAFWFIPISWLALRSESRRLRAFLIVFWVVTSVGLLNSNMTSIISTAPPKPTMKCHSPEMNIPADTFIHIPPGIKPTNHLSISRKEGAIKGSFVIDASLFMPEYRYSTVSDETDKSERNNIMLWSHSGAVDVDIWLLPKERQNYAKMKISAKDGITARLHAADRPRCAMSVSSAHGPNAFAEFHLPRSFKGFLYIKDTPRPTMSDELLQRSMLLVDTDEEKMYFVGNFSQIHAFWIGDDIRATGQVHFRYLPIDVPATSYSTTT